MKRHNIYLYEYSNGLKGKNVGFCRLDISGHDVKIYMNIKAHDMGLNQEEVVEINIDLLMEDGNHRKIWQNNSLKDMLSLTKAVKMQDAHNIVGISVVFLKSNHIKINVQGLIENRSQLNVCEAKDAANASSRIKQIELEDTVYNVDLECIKEKYAKSISGVDEKKVKATCKDDGTIKTDVSDNHRELIKLRLEDVTSLPRSCWKIAKNKFLVCGCNRHGHFAYIKQGDKYIICVPGSLDERNAGCARRFGFKSYFNVEEKDKEGEFGGYWMMYIN